MIDFPLKGKSLFEASIWTEMNLIKVGFFLKMAVEYLKAMPTTNSQTLKKTLS